MKAMKNVIILHWIQVSIQYSTVASYSQKNRHNNITDCQAIRKQIYLNIVQVPNLSTNINYTTIAGADKPGSECCKQENPTSSRAIVESLTLINELLHLCRQLMVILYLKTVNILLNTPLHGWCKEPDIWLPEDFPLTFTTQFSRQSEESDIWATHHINQLAFKLLNHW